MGLLTILKKIKEKEKEIRLLILGLDNAGKTTIVRKFCGEAIDTIQPTLGFNIQTIVYKNYNLNLWDVGGQKTIRAYWRNYFEQTDGLIWVVDSADRARLEQCRDELVKLLQQERLAGASLLIFANKQDVPGALSSEQIAQTLGLLLEVPNERDEENLSQNIGSNDEGWDETATKLTDRATTTTTLVINDQFKNRHCSIRACSAFDGDGLAEGMDWLVNDIASRIFMLS